jgi:hypothetical protein
MKYTIEREDDSFEVEIEITRWSHERAEPDVGIMRDYDIPADWDTTCPDGKMLTKEEQDRVDSYVTEKAEYDG